MKMRLLALCVAAAGLMLAGCGDNEKKVTGPAMDGVMEQGSVEAPAAKVAASPLWTAAGPGTVTLTSDGSSADPEMSYALSGSSVWSTQTWQFNTTATQTGPVALNYQYSGFHAWFQVRVFLQAVVNGVPVATLASAGPANCCSSPSGGFNYSGSYTFNVTAGQTYGFRFGGSNFDSDARLLGTFILPHYTPPAPVDTTPPAITLNGPADLTLECHVDTYTEAGAAATDDVDGPVAVSTSGSVNTAAEGNYTITYSATDAAGNTATATRTVHVVDTTAPALSLVVSPKSLWPPNHLMVEVGEIVATDLCDPSASLSITVTSNEPQNGTGDGDTAPDWEIVDNGDGTASVSVRAERKGNGTGRIYTISVTATDEAGNNSSKTGTVTVAQSQGKKK